MNEQETLMDAINHPCNSMNGCQPCTNCKEDKRQILALMGEGHTYHCACRLIWGDGQCECRKEEIAPGPISKMILKLNEV